MPNPQTSKSTTAQTTANTTTAKTAAAKRTSTKRAVNQKVEPFAPAQTGAPKSLSIVPHPAAIKYPAKPSIRVLAACIVAKVPIIMWGNPGEGKTAVLNALGRAWGQEVTTILVSTRDVTDFSGLPLESNGRQAHLPIGWALDANSALDRGFTGAIVFLDEFSTAEPRVRKASLRILQERVVGETKLKDHVALVAAANPVDQAVDGWDLAPPEANRFLHVYWQFDAEQWFSLLGGGFTTPPTYALNELLYPGDRTENRARSVALVTGFLRANPQHHTPGVPNDPVQAAEAWPSPRSWANLVDVLAQLNPDDLDARYVAMRAAVGEAVALELATYSAATDLYNPADVLADPSIVQWNEKRPDQLYAVLTAVTTLTRVAGDIDTWEKAFAVAETCANAGLPDVALPAIRELLAIIPEDAMVPASAATAFGDLYRELGRWVA